MKSPGSSAVDPSLAGVFVGHWTDDVAITGCSAVLLPEGAVASGEIRGGAPATREFALLEPTRMVSCVDAVMLSGGSAFGLACCDGAMQHLGRAERGFETAYGRVPIVVGMSIFDLGVGLGDAFPGAAAGELALSSASTDFLTGAVGAGRGATVSKWADPEHKGRQGGFGTATAREGEVCVQAFVVANAAGDLVGTVAESAAPETASIPTGPGRDLSALVDSGSALENTTIAVVVTNARLDKLGCHIVAQGGHDGYARAIFPPHMRVDGDAVVAAATGAVDAGRGAVDLVRALAIEATVAALGSLAD